MTIQKTAQEELKGIEWNVQYDAICSLFTHPRQLAAHALMSGFKPKDPHKARILELGCATGGNLTPIAGSLPRSECVGIDPFKSQIEIAQQRAAQASITNVKYLPIGVSDLDQIEGEFDYIIAHGLFSWISDEHRADTLELCKEKLSENGLAYISLNTYPGWHQRELVRHIVRWQKRVLERAANSRGEPLDDKDLIKQSRLALKFFSQSALSQSRKGSREMIAQVEADLSIYPDWYLVHEYLLEHNHPLYFERFVEMLNQHGLTYLGDASSNVHHASRLLSKTIFRELALMSKNPLDIEQGIDFLLNRTMRRAIITRGSDRVSPYPPLLWGEEQEGQNRKLNQELFVASPLIPSSEITELTREISYASQTSLSQKITLQDPVENALVILLSTVWPEPLTIEALMQQSALLLADFGLSELINTRSDALTRLIARDLIYQPTWGKFEEVSDLSPLLPWLRGGSDLQRNLTNRHHYSVQLSVSEHQELISGGVPERASSLALLCP